MFSNRIANSAKFLQMPIESQLLYFHMILRADDDGIVEAYPLIKLLGTAPDNLKVLLAKGFIRQLNEDQVVVIMDWNEHNIIRADRKVDSIYIHLLKTNFPELPYLEPKPRSDVKDNSKRLSGLSTDGISKGKVSKVKLIKDKSGKAFPTLEEVKIYFIEKEFIIDPVYFHGFFTTSDWIDTKGNKVLNWKLKAYTWNNLEKKKDYKQTSDPMEKFYA